MKHRWWLLLCIGLLPVACVVLSDQQEAFVDMKKFENDEIEYRMELGNLYQVSKAYVKSTRQEAIPKNTLPLKKINKKELLDYRSADANSVAPSVYRLGHSTVLIRMAGGYILTDPVFSERASPVQWMGPKRFHPVPIDIEALPLIKAVVISHDHYDHLDKASIQMLSGKVEQFVVPMNVGRHLMQWGIEEHKITELDWWEETTVGPIKLVATPAQHFSGRGLLDRDETLWASWVIESVQARVFFSGDSGYFSGFKKIGEEYGPFDLTIIETGAYNELWSDIHMLPEQSVQAHVDLKGKAMMPVHNSTFDLALHDWYEPFERALAASKQQNVKLVTPIIGERVSIHAPTLFNFWWRDVVENMPIQVAYQD